MPESQNHTEEFMKSDETVRLGTRVFHKENQELVDSNGKPVDLRLQSLQVLSVLAALPGETVSKTTLIESIWGDIAVTDSSLVQCIADIRRALGKDGRDCIQTVPRRGYRLQPTSDKGRIPAPANRSIGTVMIAAVAALVVVVWGISIAVPPTAEEPSTETATAEIPTLAVLPFTNMSGDPDQLYFSDGLTEDLTTDLSTISGLRMISRVSSFSYRETNMAPRDIAVDLGATHFVTGSVRRDGQRVRINATLSDAWTGTNVWAERYDRELATIFELQDDVTRAIATALQVQLTSGEEEERLSRNRTIDPDAYELLLRGLVPFRAFTAEGTAEARRYFRRALEIEPDYARARANLALSYARSVVFRFAIEEDAIEIASRQAALAVALDENLPQVQFALAVTHLAARNHEAAIEAAKKTVQLEPSYADGYAVLAQTLALGGDLNAALDAIQTAKALSPRHLFDYLWVEGHILFLMRRYEEAQIILEEVIERNPAFLTGYLTLAATYGHLGDIENADWLAAEILTLSPNVSASEEGDHAVYRNEKDREHFVQGLVLAGLPE